MVEQRQFGRAMKLSANTLASAMRDMTQESAVLWIEHVNAALVECRCRTPEQVAQWIAHVGHESRGLTRLVESLDYSVDALLKNFGRHRISIDDAMKYGRTPYRAADQLKIGCCIYGGDWGVQNLGNRLETYDGWHFRGQGPIQITGRSNVELCSRAINVDLLADPSLLQTRGIGCRSTAWFWLRHNLAGHNGAVETVTRLINGGTNGLADRLSRYQRAISVLTGR